MNPSVRLFKSQFAMHHFIWANSLFGQLSTYEEMWVQINMNNRCE